MKKIVIVVLILLFCFCIYYFVFLSSKNAGTDALTVLGYTIEDVKVIKNNLNNKELSSLEELAYNKTYIKLIVIKNFKFIKLNDYIECFNDNEVNNYSDIVFLVNKGLDVKCSLKLMEIFKNEYYLEVNANRYIDYYKLGKEDIVKEVNSNLDYVFYSNIKKANIDDDLFILVNKYYSLNESYIPNDLKRLEGYSDSFMLRSSAADAYIRMENEASKEGFNFSATSPYRGFKTQYGLYYGYASIDGYEEADRYSARPGHSEHQTGLAIDVVSNSGGGLDGFGSSKEFIWMKENAYKYGFILRYTKETEYITGYMDEPWHYRYLGIEHAKKIKSLGITFEEYYAFYIDK